MANDPLHLRDLPQLDPPEGLWSDISADLDASAHAPNRPARGRFRAPLWTVTAAAAVVTLAVVLTLTLQGPGFQPVEEPARLAQLQALSAALETRLEQSRYGVVDAATADSLARIEQEMAWLDVQISASPNDPSLWTERVALLGEMNERYRRSDWRSELQLASY